MDGTFFSFINMLLLVFVLVIMTLVITALYQNRSLTPPPKRRDFASALSDWALVFMLANRDPEEQIQTLRNLAVLFGQPEKLTELRNQTTLPEMESWLRRELRLS